MGESPTQARKTVKTFRPNPVSLLRRSFSTAGSVILVLFTAATLLTASPEGVLPVGKDGKPLNLDFEDGTLKDWTASGQAFDKQPIKGDVVAARRSDMQSQHQGNYWIGTYEIAGDQPEGTLTSVSFKVTQPYASFLVAGGAHPDTRVELVRVDNQEIIFKTSGYKS